MCLGFERFPESAGRLYLRAIIPNFKRALNLETLSSLNCVDTPDTRLGSQLSRYMLKNPFLMPPDEEVFRMREEEKRRKRDERELMKAEPLLRTL
eukprot:4256636-Pyramimonas_sp.AAC.1